MEKLRNKQAESQGNSAFATKTKRRQTQGERKSDKPLGKCFKCEKVGHWKRDCRQVMQTILKKKKSSVKTEDRGVAFVVQIESAAGLISQEDMKIWYLDSGASQHMSPIRDWLVNYEELNSIIPVKTGSGKFIYVVGRGEIDIYAYDGNKWQRKYLTGVLYVPELKFNLFSLSSALDKDLELSSDSQKCKLRKDGIVIGRQTREFLQNEVQTLPIRTSE